MASVQQEPRIPRIIHIIWLGCGLPEIYHRMVESWYRLHTSWTFVFWTDHEANYHRGTEVVASFDGLRRELRKDGSGKRIVVDCRALNYSNKTFYNQSVNYGERSDILKWEIVYRFGGLYVDVDFECFLPFDELHHSYDFYTGLQPLDTGQIQLGAALFAARPAHPILRQCVNGICENQHLKAIVQKTGPLHFTRSFQIVTGGKPESSDAVFPPTYFYPCGYEQRGLPESEWRVQESMAVHHWAGSWLEQQGFVSGALDKKADADVPEEDKPFVVVITSYNAIRWYEKNLYSLMKQEESYRNWRAIYIDDCSLDGTGEAVEQYVQDRGFAHKIKVIRNDRRTGAAENIYWAVHQCENHEIICTLDGDDWFAADDLFLLLNQLYADPEVWLTYGQYREWPSGKLGRSRSIPERVIQRNAFRNYLWITSHLRTFHAWLFKRIKKEDFIIDGKFLSVTTDQAMMFPMLEMAGERIRFNPVVVYEYNMENPINNWKVRLDLVLETEQRIRRMPRYRRLDVGS